MKRSITPATVLISALISIVCSLISVPANAKMINEPCKQIEVILARGSGVKVNQADSEASYYIGQLRDRVKNSDSTINYYELGREKYGGSQYPATPIKDGWNVLGAIGASLSAGYGFAYGDSVRDGIKELQSYIKERHTKCAGSTIWILGGYSQGAQVIGQTLSTLDEVVRKDIVHVSLFGDPKLHLPEGEGRNPPACWGGAQHYSPWRRDIKNCDLDNGSLIARQPYLPDDMHNKTGMWCNDGDPVCGNVGNISNHAKYKETGAAISKAVQEASEKIAVVLRNTAVPIPNPAPNPGVPAEELVDVSMPEPDLYPDGHEIALLFSTSNSMGPHLEDVKSQFMTAAQSWLADSSVNFRVALVAYRDHGSSYSTKIVSDFTTDFNKLEQSARNGIDLELTPSDTPDGALNALSTTLRELDWSEPDRTHKRIALVSNSTFHEPDKTDGSTKKSVIQQSFRVGGVEIVSGISTAAFDQYKHLAVATDGHASVYFSDKSQRSNIPSLSPRPENPTPRLRSMQSSPGRLVAKMSTGTYKALPGQAITFDASASFLNNGKITGYEWDIDGDGITDYTSSNASIEHSYENDFSGMIRVKVWDEYGRFAKDFAQVDVTSRTPQPTPSRPLNFTSTTYNTIGTASSVNLKWDANDTHTERWILAINSDAVGYMTSDRRSVTVTDVERAEDVVFSLIGENSDGVRGEFAEVVVPALTTPPGDPETPEPPTSEEPETPTEPGTPPKNPCEKHTNYFIRMACETTERLKAQARAFLGQFYFIIGVR